MNRFKKIAGSVILAAALTISSIGAAPVETPAMAAAVTQEELMQIIEKVETATKTVASTNTVRTVTDMTLEVMGSKQNAKLETATDLNTGVMKMALPSVDMSDMSSMIGGGTIDTADAYIDLKSHIMYEYNKTLGRYELLTAPVESDLTSSLFSKDTLTKYGSLFTFGEMATSTVDGKAIISVPMQLKIDETNIKSLISSFASKRPVDGLDTIAAFIKGIDITITPFIDAETYLIGQMTAKGTVNIDFMGTALTINIDMDEKNSVSSDAVTIPSDVTKSAQLKEGYKTEAGGLEMTAVLSGKNAVLSVSGVKKTSASKLTVPASVNEYGKKYDVSKAENNAFKKAKKLKTLVVKNSALKKALKKNPSKYGLSKKVKIK